MRKMLNFWSWATRDTSDPYTAWSNFLRASRLYLQPFLETRSVWEKAPSCSVKRTQGLYSLSGKTSYRKISTPRDSGLNFSNRSEIWQVPRQPLQHPISRLRDFTRFGGKTSYRLVNRGPVVIPGCQSQHRNQTHSVPLSVGNARGNFLIMWNINIAGFSTNEIASCIKNA